MNLRDDQIIAIRMEALRVAFGPNMPEVSLVQRLAAAQDIFNYLNQDTSNDILEAAMQRVQVLEQQVRALGGNP